MSRPLIWTFAFAAVAVAALPAAADPPSPLDLVRGLRDQGMPDLALEYLDEIEKRNPTGDLRTQLGLERALSRLAAAQGEADEAARDAGIARAKGEFEAFLKANGSHPRAAEASLALARVLSYQAKAELNRAFRIGAEEGAADGPKAAARKAAAAATRPLFRRAAELYGQAAKRIDAVLADPATDPARKKALARDAAQAELDRGINQYNLADTFVAPQGAEVAERAKALADAKAVFAALGERDPASGTSWKAQAWAAMCDLEVSEKAKADDAFKRVREAAARNPAAAEGVRMVDFFDLQGKYQDARGTRNLQLIRQARTQAKNWLDRDRDRQRMTPERLSATYYYAYLTQLEGMAAVVFDKANPGKVKDVPSNARALLNEAKREYTRLVETDNEYTDRAAQNRTLVVRVLVGEATKPAKEYTSFDECQMAALVQLAGKEKDGPKRAIELLERCRELAGPRLPARERTDLLLTLAYAYWTGDRPAQAAVLAESLARSARGSTAAKAGLIAVEGYLAARAKLDEADEDARAADRERAVSLATYLDRTFPADPAADGVRFRLGRLYLESKEYRAAFDVLGRISPTYPGAAAARTAQGGAAYQLINAKDSPLPPAEKAAVFRRAVADAEAVPEPTRKDEFKAYLGLRNLLAQLYLSAHTPDGAAKAEAIAAEAGKKAAAATALLDEPERKAAAFAAEEVRLRAVYAQAAEPFRKGDYKAAADRLAPALADMAKAGPAAAAKLDGDGAVAADALDRFRREVVGLALQARVREGAADSAVQLFDLLDSLGGSVEATTDALNRLVGVVRAQADEQRKAGKAEEADKLTADMAGLIQKQAAKPKLSARATALLGKSLRDLGAFDKAIEVLKRVPAADPADLQPAAPAAAQGAEANEDAAAKQQARREAAAAHRIAQLELARAYRGAKQYPAADEVLKAALGADGKGWARQMLEYRREAVLLLEDKAADAPADKRAALWAEARAGWTRIASDYAGAIRAKLPADEAQRLKAIQDREKLVPVYLELVCDEKRCLTRMVDQLQKGDKAKLAKSMGVIAQQVVDVEKANAKGLSGAVRAKFAALLDDYPTLKDEYAKRGGKEFLAPASAETASDGK
jgi:hypothetical protein